MRSVFKSVAIIGRQNTVDTRKTLSNLIKHLQSKKINIALEHDTAKILPSYKLPVIPREELHDNCELIIVVGGDGSLLSAARIAARQDLPIIGINRGKLGFLTDIAPDNITKIDAILAGNFYEEQRFLLATEMCGHDKVIIRNIALNDIAFLSYIAGHMIDFSVHVDQHFLCNYHADGLIIASPTGSTAHALSGGGPILHPALEAVVLVPMLSHNLNSRPIVIKSDSTIKVAFNNANTTDLLVRCDGQVQTMLHGSSIKIKKAKEKLRLLHPTDYSYFETLRTKLHWETK
ncbi:NAD kinase [Gammaproteobacteria bacterium]